MVQSEIETQRQIPKYNYDKSAEVADRVYIMPPPIQYIIPWQYSCVIDKPENC